MTEHLVNAMFFYMVIPKIKAIGVLSLLMFENSILVYE